MKEFEKINEEFIPEANLTLLHFRHRETLAEVLLVETTDINKTFAITFPTLPLDHKGTTHILEHSVFNGSKKYPFPELLTLMSQGSLKSYLNAFTTNYCTAYPISSQFQKDLFNLADVYIDFVFNPLLDKESFMQEAWHLELDKLNKPKFSGIVFNEMKAHSNNKSSVFETSLLKEIYAGTPYSLEYGGDPEFITDLTLDELRDYHRINYNISNARFFFYGDTPTEENLRFLNDRIKDLKPNLQPAVLKSFYKSHDIKSTATYPIGEKEEKSFYKTYSYQIPRNKIKEFEIFGFFIIKEILFNLENGILTKKLLKTGLINAIENYSFELFFLDPILSFTINFNELESEEFIDQIVFTTLERYSRENFPKHYIESVLANFQFDLREKEKSGSTEGISKFFNLLPDWLHGMQVSNTFKFEENLKSLEFEINFKKLLPKLIKKFLLNSQAKAQITFLPDEFFVNKLVEKEAQKLLEIEKSLDETKIENIKKDMLLLKEYSKPKENAKVPQMSLSDLKTKESSENFDTKLLGENSHLFYAFENTNSVSYLDMYFDISHLNTREIELLNLLFSGLLFKLDSKFQKSEELNTKKDLFFGDLDFDLGFFSDVSGKEHRKLTVFAKYLPKDMYEILGIFDTYINFIEFKNPKALVEIIAQNILDLESNFTYSAHASAMDYSASFYNVPRYLDSLTTGIRFYQFLKDIKSEDPNILLGEIEKVYQKAFNKKNLKIALTTEEKNFDYNTKFLNKLIAKFSYFEEKKVKITLPQAPSAVAFSIPTDISFTGRYSVTQNTANFRFTNFNWTEIFDDEYFWKKIRLENNSYGGGIKLSIFEGAFFMYSYRDPKPDKTLEIYNTFPDFVNNFSVPLSSLENCKISLIGKFDKYISIGSRAVTAMLRTLKSETLQYRQKRRDDVLKADPNSLEKFKESISNLSCTTTIISSEKILKKLKLAENTDIINLF